MDRSGEAAMGLVVDTFRFGSREVPGGTRSRSRATTFRRSRRDGRLQELAFTLIDGLEYVKWAVAAGLDVNDFVPHLSFFFESTTTSSRSSEVPRGAPDLGARDRAALSTP